MALNWFLFCFSLTVVNVRGKRGRQVPVLVNQAEENAIATLIKYRSTIGIPDSNPFVFACPTRDSQNALRGNPEMIKVLKNVEDLKFPERIRSTELRKYCATVT